MEPKRKKSAANCFLSSINQVWVAMTTHAKKTMGPIKKPLVHIRLAVLSDKTDALPAPINITSIMRFLGHRMCPDNDCADHKSQRKVLNCPHHFCCLVFIKLLM